MVIVLLRISSKFFPTSPPMSVGRDRGKVQMGDHDQDARSGPPGAGRAGPGPGRADRLPDELWRGHLPIAPLPGASAKLRADGVAAVPLRPRAVVDAGPERSCRSRCRP